METLEIIIFIIIGIGVLVGGYFLLKKYNDIDNALFSSMEEDYKPFGLYYVYASAILGAFAVVAFIIAEMTNARGGWDGNVLLPVFNLFILIACTAVFYTFIYLRKPKAIVYKSLFMILYCTLAMIVGALASVVLIGCLIIYILAKALTDFAKSSVSVASNDNSAEKKQYSEIEAGGLQLQHRHDDVYYSGPTNKYYRKMSNGDYEEL